jgi:hypothetical protein
MSHEKKFTGQRDSVRKRSRTCNHRSGQFVAPDTMRVDCANAAWEADSADAGNRGIMKKPAAVVGLTLGLSVTAGLLLHGGAVTAQKAGACLCDKFRVETITGTDLKLIQAALPEFTRWKGPNLDDYRISVSRFNAKTVVSFDDVNAPPVHIGSWGRGTLEVELKEDGTIIRSYLAK